MYRKVKDMKKYYKRYMSFLLSIILVLSFFSVSVTAADEDDEQNEEVNLFSLNEEDYPSDQSPDLTPVFDETLVEESVECRSADAIAPVSSSVGSVSASAVDEEEDENPVEMEEKQWDDGEPQNSEMVLLQAGTSIDLSKTELCLAAGSTSTIELTINNFGGGKVGGHVSNDDAIAAKFGGKNGNRLSCIISAKKTGDGTVTFKCVDRNGTTVAQKILQVSVIASSYPKITVSRSSLNVERGSRESITVTHNLPDSNVYVSWGWSDNGVISSGWAGRWNDAAKTNFTLYVTGQKSGDSWIKLTLYNRFNQALAYTYISPVKVYEKENPTLSVNPTSITMHTGDTSRVRINAGGVSGTWGLRARCYRNYYSIKWQKINSNSYDIYITAISNGQKNLEIQLLDGDGNVLRSAITAITIQTKQNPRLEASRSKITVTAGSYTSITFTAYGVTENCYVMMKPSKDNTIGWRWTSNNNGQLTASIVGYSTYNAYPVNLTLTVCLFRKSDVELLHTLNIPVSITAPQSKPPMAYGFINYTTTIPLSTWEIIYGSGQKVKSAAERLGQGGVCYGMAASAVLCYYNIDSLGVSNYRNISSIHNMNDTSLVNGTLNFRLAEIIEAMHVTQFRRNLNSVPNVQYKTWTAGPEVVSKTIISEIGNGRPVLVCMNGKNSRGRDIGHTVLAYAISYPSSKDMLVRVYDANDTDVAGTITFSRQNDSGPYTEWYFSNFDLGTGNPNNTIRYELYSDNKDAWLNRRVYGRASLLSIEDVESSNLLITSEKSFELYRFDEEEPWNDGILVLKCANGDVIEIDDSIERLFNYAVLPNGTMPEQDLMFSLPTDYYTFKDLNLDDGVEAVLSDNEHSVTVSTEAHRFSFYAQDAENAVGAHVDTEDGELFSVSIGSSVEGEPDERSYDGIGVNGGVSVLLAAGVLSETGMEGASISVSTGEARSHYSVNEYHTGGGSVSFEGDRHIDLGEGDSCLVNIAPDAGYEIASVRVDGMEVGAVTSYVVTDITDNHQIEVDFRRPLSACSAQLLSYNDHGEPVFSVRNDAGVALELGADYNVSTLDSNTYILLASEDSPYTGVLVYVNDKCEIKECNLDEDLCLQVTLSGNEASLVNSIIAVAVYNEKGKMQYITTKNVTDFAMELDISKASINSGSKVYVFWLNSKYVPITKKAEAKQRLNL